MGDPASRRTGSNYWLIIGNGNAYPITSNGVGAPVSNFNLSGSGASFRYSSDGRRIAVGWSSPKMFVYDFDPATGKFGASYIEINRGSVFVEFAHLGKKLYVNDTVAGALFQYDLNADPGPGSTVAAEALRSGHRKPSARIRRRISRVTWPWTGWSHLHRRR